MVVAGPQTQLNKRTRVGNGFALPSIVALVAAHGCFACFVPLPCCFAGQVVFANQGFLNLLCALGVDDFLSAYAGGFLAARRMLAGSLMGSSGFGCGS